MISIIMDNLLIEQGHIVLLNHPTPNHQKTTARWFFGVS